MASKFIPPPDQINTISAKKTKKSFSNLSKQSIFHEIKRNIKESYTTDAFEQVGQMNAIVLEVITEDPTKMLWKNPLMSWAYHERQTIPDYIEVRYRVPEIHAHLPEPTWAGDWIAINRHPKAIMKKDKGVPEVGDIVTLDFKDKNNFSQAMVVESFNTSEAPNPGGNCSSAEAFGSGIPSFNTAPATGDTQESKPSEYSAENDPAEESYDIGIDYTKPKEKTKDDMSTNKPKKSIYFVSIDNLNTMTEFLNLDKTIEILASKNVFSVCFNIAEEDRIFSDASRLSKLINILNENNFDVGVSMKYIGHENEEVFDLAYIMLTDMIRVSKYDYICNYIPEDIDSSTLELRDIAFSTFAASQGIEYFLISDSGEALPENIYADKVFMSANHYDYYDKDKPTAFDIVVSNNDINHWSGSPRLRTMYYLDGNNFLKTPANDCLYGERTISILSNEWKNTSSAPYGGGSWSREKINNNIWMNYEALDVPKIEWIAAETSTDSHKQNLLSSAKDIRKRNKAEVINIVGVLDTPILEPPRFNEIGGSQDSSEIPPPSQPAVSPGASCAPLSGGQTSMGGTNAGSSAPVQPPSYRFDSIPGSESLGWAASSHHIINDVIFEWMERFSAAVYRRLPMNSPSFTGSLPKKIKLTSTARTADKQVELMWDKIDHEGDNGVWKIYGSGSAWVRDVVKGYHANDRATPVGIIQARIDNGQVSGHLSGKGVDVHTFSHLSAEGLQGSGASLATMNSSKFVKACVEAAAECGGRTKVEAYQQHIHITIL